MVYALTLPQFDVFETWRAQARALASNRIPPEQVSWRRIDASRNLFEALGETSLPEVRQEIFCSKGVFKSCRDCNMPCFRGRVFHALPPYASAYRCTGDHGESCRSRCQSGDDTGQVCEPRCPQNEGFRPFQGNRFFRERAPMLCELVRTRPLYCRVHGWVLCAALRRHGLDHLHAAWQRNIVGWHAVLFALYRKAAGPSRCHRRSLANLLRQYLQPRPAQDQGHAIRDAQEVLAKSARGRVDSWIGAAG